MEGTGRLSQIIGKRLEEHRGKLAEQQLQTDTAMKELLDQRERFNSVCRRLVETVVQPRMAELPRFFDNATLADHHGETDTQCVCSFFHTPQFPATVSFKIVLLPGEGTLKARCDVAIFPALMDYKRDEETAFTLDVPDEDIGAWVEERIVEFVDTYLRLETHPLYQKDNLVTDPVCGMRISAVAAKCKLEWPGKTIYFCSELCREAFQKELK